MQIQYFQTAWNDIKNSPGWFGKLCLLALVSFIPIFGQVVIAGYLYGWAREIAWGVHEPMPAHIFGNEDGKLYRRGWFIFVLGFVLGLVPAFVTSIGSSMQSSVYFSALYDGMSANLGVAAGAGTMLYLVGVVCSFIVYFFQWVGSMRISIYDRLSPGFQLGKAWRMMRQDSSGILRIFGMNLLVGFLVGLVVSVVVVAFIFLVAFLAIGNMAASGVSADSLQYMSDAESLRFLVQFFGAAGAVGFVGLFVIIYCALVANMFVETLTARALGYWTMQFDVPHWRGQDDPMPFEELQAAQQ